jgi:hypothetical protein
VPSHAEDLAVSPGSEVTFRNVTGTGAFQWLTFHYNVNDPEGMRTSRYRYIDYVAADSREAGQAHITLNDDVVPTNLSDLNSRAGYQSEIPVQLRLFEGDINTIRVGATGSKGA